MRNKLLKNSIGFIFLIITLIALLTACNPRNLPGFRQLAESEDARMRKVAEEKIRTSPVFNDLNELCTNEIPIYEGFSLINLHASWKEPDSLSYFYYSDAGWHEVKNFYKDYFSKEGWRVVDEFDTSWGSNTVDVKKNNYRVTLYNQGLGRRANYGFRCEKLSTSNKGVE